MEHIYKYSVALLLLLTTACQSPDRITSIEDFKSGSLNAEARLATKAQVAINEGRGQEALKSYELAYRRANPLTEEIILNYAQLLRNSGMPKTAINIINKQALDNKGNIREEYTAVLLNELAANKLENGEFKEAETITRQVISNQEYKTFHNDAYNLLGISLDSQGKHGQAEVNFRLALNGWKGNDSLVKNNLAICLASQGKFDESLLLLRQALIDSTNKEEISKNIELINSIRNSIIARPSNSRI